MELLSSSTLELDFTLLLHLLANWSSSPSHKLLSISVCTLLAISALWVLAHFLIWPYPGGPAWGLTCLFRNPHPPSQPIPGPRGLPFLGSLLHFAGPGRAAAAHRHLSALASLYNARPLMALSLGSTRLVVSSQPSVARQILCNSAFSERPLSQSARQLLFARAVGFAPHGDHWRNLRRLATSHLFSPRRIAAHEDIRQLEASQMLKAIDNSLSSSPVQKVRPYLQHAALNNIMGTVFGRRYEFSENASSEAAEVQAMVREGFELLGAFNMADHLPAAFASIDPLRIQERCDELVPRVYAFVQKIIEDHRTSSPHCEHNRDACDFVDVLLGLQADEKLSDEDMVSVLWEMIFRGTDTIAILIEWILAELVLNPKVQAKLHAEVVAVAETTEDGALRDGNIAKMPYLQAVVKEGLRMHPPGPLLSWARLAVHDVEVAGHHIPAGTTAMVNMWAITHDPAIWPEPEKFLPERFLVDEGGIEVDVRGGDLRLAPFGAGARVCPGKAMAMATVNLWVARIVQNFQMGEDHCHPVDLSEVLKLSCEMEVPLCVHFTNRMDH